MKTTNKHQKAHTWLTNMEMGREYHPSLEQIEILLDIFCDKYLVLPTHPTEGFDYYYNIGENFKTICKHPLTNPAPAIK